MTRPSTLLPTIPTWTFFGGKGGVGKTTCAAAWALARVAEDRRVLLLSTDPAHSLADALDTSIGARPKRVRLAGTTAAGRPRRKGYLAALELNASSAVSHWLKGRRPLLARLLERGTLLDRQDIARVLQLPLPGLDELAAFLTMSAVERAGAYDEIIVDTAPTGHTLRLLDVPRLVGTFARLLEAMHERHTIVVEALGARAATDPLVDELRQDAEEVERRLHDPLRSTISWVALPEPVVIAETIQAVQQLCDSGFPLQTMVVNRATPARPRACSECAARLRQEREALAPLAEAAKQLRLCVVEDQGREPRGIAGLRKVARQLQHEREWHEFVPARHARRHRPGRAPRSRLAAGAPVLRLAKSPLLFFGGKGGVGKTTCAAGAAVAIARHTPARRVRLISTDPAPSLGDVLGLQIGDTWTSVPGRWHLEVRELDAAAVFDGYRQQYKAAVHEFFDRLRGRSAFDASTDRAILERLFDLAPPGIDELIALLTVVDLAGDGGADHLIVDTAPTGHTLRLLGMQGDVQQWVALLMQLVLKYQLAGRAEALAQDLVRISRALRLFRARLGDPARSCFVAVVRAGALPRLETARLVAELRRLDVAASVLIANAGRGGTCAACRTARRLEREETLRLRQLCRGSQRACDIMHAPLELPAPRGPDVLLEWAAAWRMD